MKASTTVESAGRQAAAKWLKGQERDELCRIKEQIGEVFETAEAENAFFFNDIDAFTVAERLYMVLAGTDRYNFNREDAAEFWGSLNDDAEPDVDFVYGFALGLID